MKAKKPVFLNGRIIEVGNKFSCSIDFSKKLIESNTAELVEEKQVIPNEDRKRLESMTKEELLKLVEEKAISDISEKNKKDEIIDSLMKVIE